MTSRLTRGGAVLVAVVALAGSGAWWLMRVPPVTLPLPGSPAYEQAARAFYHGLAAMEVGLLDDARLQFTRATEAVPGEPAAWANLGLTELRRGEAEAAADPVARALALAPDQSELVLLAARMEASRGRVDESLAYLRRAVTLDVNGLRARFALAEEVERSGQPGADADAQALLDELILRAPGNLTLRLERARLAAKRSDAAGLRAAVVALEPLSASWPPLAGEQFQGLQVAAKTGAVSDAVRFTILLRNVLARVPAFSESLAAVRTPAELIAEPFDRFLALVAAPPMPSPPDTAVTFSAEPVTASDPVTSLVAVPVGATEQWAVFGVDATALRRLDAGLATWPLPSGVGAPASALLTLDWNHDFLSDIAVAGPGGIRLLLQAAEGTFVDRTPRGPSASDGCPCTGVWAADVEMDGDVDIVVGAVGATNVLRNNGDGTWQPLQTFGEIRGARAFAWGDLDGDADPDAAFLDVTGTLRVAVNRQGGAFASSPAPATAGTFAALTIVDLDADGVHDLVVLDVAGRVSRVSWNGRRFEAREVARWEGFQEGASAENTTPRLFAGDLDNNGAMDLVGSSPSGSRVWLADEGRALRALPQPIVAQVFAVADTNRDGRLDLMGLASGRPVWLIGGGALNYHWKALRPRAQQNAGDQRINSFGVGGEVEVRSGLLWQRQILTGPVVHFGLGVRTSIDVARIVWPNGVPQAEFDIGVDDAIVAEQRLKGSCPWVFADDGTGPQFVTDFLWRSPLGLRINAQVTAGVTQTEDWVKIRGDQLAARNGAYDLRITAELWEAHFFDHVSLAVVDHPAGADVYVDERFSPTRPQSHRVVAVQPPSLVAGAWDETGRDVTSLVGTRDGRYLATFARGTYQGIAREHSVEIDLGPAAARAKGTLLVATGWVYPTDSSINLAISQGASDTPSGVVLEAQDAGGRWRVVDPDLGFPAGKNKTMLIDLAGVGDARRVRLRTNLEVYWDWLALTTPSQEPVRVNRLPLSGADLRFRGFSRTRSPRGDEPETPDYADLANTTQRWRDLVGYYTRFGDVRELLSGVDDRYVIMNAGDEMRLRFDAPPVPPAGWTRDFVLIGDGWEKDGDYNTSHSQTVLPLPSHAVPDYGVAAASHELEADPVYRQFPGDWVRYHTRFVSPTAFVNGLSVSARAGDGRIGK